MKRASVTLLCLIGAIPCLAQAGLLSWWFGQPWSFMQSVGGIRVTGAERLPDGSVSLDVDCDVSGLRAVTVRPTTLNSAIGVGGVAVKRRESTLILSVHGAAQATCTCPHPTLRSLPAGEYAVAYQGSDRQLHPLGSVIVP